MVKNVTSKQWNGEIDLNKLVKKLRELYKFK